MRKQYNSKLYKTNRKLILMGNPSCFNCPAPATTADHIIPTSKGGDSSLSNLRPACLRCNSSRGNKTSLRYRATW